MNRDQRGVRFYTNRERESQQRKNWKKFDFYHRSPILFRFRRNDAAPAALCSQFPVPMPIWLIEILGARSLDHTFLLIALMTIPVWIGMIVFPKAKIVLKLAHPLVLPPA